MTVPYTTKSGVRIGQLWASRPPAMSEDAIRIQRAFVDPVTERGHRVATWLGGVALAVVCSLLIAGVL